MTYFRELPKCVARFGRTDITEIEKNGIIKKTAKMLITCGYREVEPEECIICQGFTDIKLEFHIDTFIRVVKGKCFILKGRESQNFHENDEK